MSSDSHERWFWIPASQQSGVTRKGAIQHSRALLHRRSAGSPPVGGITAWFTMRLTAIAAGTDKDFDPGLDAAISAYESRDDARVATWKEAFKTRERPARNE